MSKEAIQHYESALKEAFPSGATGDVFFHWNEARKALAEQPAQQEPDAIGCKCSECGKWQRWTPSGMTCKNGHGGAPGINHRLYTTPQPQAQPAREWVSLTDEQVIKTFNAICNGKPFSVERILELHRATEAKLKDKNAK